MKLSWLNGNYSVCRRGAKESIPSGVESSEFYSISRTKDELSLVLESEYVQFECKEEKGWKVIKVLGPLDFSLTGILASIAQPLADHKISIFAISTFDTDYILVKADNINQVQSVLTEKGFQFL